MKKKNIVIVSAIAVILAAVLTCIYFFVPISFGNHSSDFQAPESLPMDTLLTKEQVQEDRDQMITYIEHIHPYFVAEEDMTAYYTAKENYLAQTADAMTIGEFQVETGEYISFFGDGHTVFYWPEEEWLYVPWEYRDGRMYLKEDTDTTSGMDSTEQENKYITYIGGIAIEDILALITRMVPAENEMAQQKNFENYADGKNLLTFLGADVKEQAADDGSLANPVQYVTVLFSDGTAEEFTFKAPSGGQNEADNAWYWEEDIFVVDFNVCVDDNNLKQIAKELEKAVKAGTKKVMIDVRGNGGGNSNACKRLLSAMGMKAPEYGMLIRFSEEAAAQNGYLRKSDSIQFTGSSRSKSNENVELVVLSDRKTFSSAAMLLVWVRDGGLGTIIGEPSINRPSHYGDIIYYKLENSHIWGTISHKQFIRPDERIRSGCCCRISVQPAKKRIMLQ